MSRRIRDIWWSCVQVESCKSHKTTPPTTLKKTRKKMKTDPDADVHTCVNIRVLKTHLGRGSGLC